MRHVLPDPRQGAIRWLGRAISVIGLLALLVLPLADTGSGAPFHPKLPGIGQLEKALPAEFRTGRPSIASTDKAPGGPAPTSDPARAASAPDGASEPILARHPALARVARAPFPRPASQAPPVAI